MQQRHFRVRHVFVLCAAIAAAGVARAQSLFVTSSASDSVLEFDSNTGAFLGSLLAGAVDEPRTVRIGPDGKLYVADLNNDRIVRCDLPAGTSAGPFVAAGSGGLDGPWAVEWSGGVLFVTHAATSGKVLKYSAATGAFLGTFATATGVPQGLLASAGGHLFVAWSAIGEIREYDIATAALVKTFSAPGVFPRGLAFGPSGTLYVACALGDSVLSFDIASGASLGAIVPTGSGGLDAAQDVAIRSDGHLLVSSAVNHRVLEYDASGAFVGVLVPAGSGGLSAPVGLELGLGVLGPAPAFADYGDAPDAAPVCGAGGGAPSAFPTLFGSANAFAGRNAPFHVSQDQLADFHLGAGPSTEATPYQPTCDWVTRTTLAGPCDHDDGPIVLCLDPMCKSGVLVVDAGPYSIAAAAFGPPPPMPVLGFWVYDVSIDGLASGAIPRFANVVVDWDLSAKYGDAGLEWAAVDDPIPFTPFASQTHTTALFPVLTVAPAPGTVLGWSIGPFWSRFLVSTESLGPVFPALDWDGSGKATGYSWGETEDWVVLGDPPGPGNALLFPDCDANGVPDEVDIAFGYLHDGNGDGQPDECGFATTYCTAKTNSLGCVPYVGAAGVPSASSPLPCNLSASRVLNQKSGLMFYGYSIAGAPFQGGTLCAQPPLQRLPLINSGGSANQDDCSGSYSVDFKQRIQSGVDPMLVPGAPVHAQFWSRDNGFAPPNNTGLTNAVRFVVQP